LFKTGDVKWPLYFKDPSNQFRRRSSITYESKIILWKAFEMVSHYKTFLFVADAPDK